MLNRKAIAVYNPSDVWEQAIMSAHREFNPNEDFLPSFACQLAARAILNLKTVNWVEDELLRKHRARYFFSPSMTSFKDEMVFVNYPLFIRDIVENETINCCLHDPIVFVTTAIAHYLLKEFPNHITVRWDDVVADNHDVDFIDVGGMYIVSGKNVVLKKSSILSISEQSTELRKAASTQISNDVYEIDEHSRNLHPATEVWDKEKRIAGEIDEVGIGEKGVIRVVYRDGKIIDLPQNEFDMRFILPAKTAQNKSISNKAFPIKIDGTDYQLNEHQIGAIIKSKLLQSKTIRKLFDEFKVPITSLRDLNIVITDLEKKYAESDGRELKLSKDLFTDGDFFKYNFYICAHEAVHFAARHSPNPKWRNNDEGKFYFDDIEETIGFISSIAYEMESDVPLPEIWEKIYNKVNFHFNNENDAELFFKRMIEKAKQFAY